SRRLSRGAALGVPGRLARHPGHPLGGAGSRLRRAAAAIARARRVGLAAGVSVALLAGYAADLLVGDPARLHPVAGFGRVASALERRLWRPRRPAGAAPAALLVAASGGAVALARRLARGRPRTRALLDAGAVWACLGGRSLAREARGLAGLVEAGDLAAARARARSLVGRDTSALDGPELCRAAVESVAENAADAGVGPPAGG